MILHGSLFVLIGGSEDARGVLMRVISKLNNCWPFRSDANCHGVARVHLFSALKLGGGAAFKNFPLGLLPADDGSPPAGPRRLGVPCPGVFCFY